MKKIAIIGSGFFGVATALMLAKKHEVHIYEIKNDILNGASLANQLRFHLGYHYPRSSKTLKEVNESYNDFIKFYSTKVFGNTKNYYGVSKKDSKTSKNKYIKFLKKNKLYFKICQNTGFTNNISLSFLSKEKNLNYFKIKKIIKKKLKSMNIKIFYNTQFPKKKINEYDKTIIATYDQNNTILKKLGYTVKKKFKFELVEKIIIKLDKTFQDKSFMVVDGQFICLDPYLGTKYHLLSSNKYSKIETRIGYLPNFKNTKKKYLNKGMIRNKKISYFDNFISHGSKYLKFLNKAKYIGSYYVVRALETNKEKTDERLNKINNINDKIISIFSGKWNTSITVAKKIVNML